MLNRQKYFPESAADHNILRLCDLGLAQRTHSDTQIDIHSQSGQNWTKASIYRNPMFILQVAEQYLSADTIGYTYQQDWIKFNFKLAGRGTTVLNGFGECEHKGPEVFITAGPPEMLKVDLRPRGFNRWLALCVPPDYFSQYLHWISMPYP